MSQYPPQGPQQPPDGPTQPQYPPSQPLQQPTPYQHPYQQPPIPQSMPSTPMPPRPPYERLTLAQTLQGYWHKYRRQTVPKQIAIAVVALFLLGAFISAANQNMANTAKYTAEYNATATASALQASQPTPTPKPTHPSTPTATPKPLSVEDQAKKTLKDQSALIQDKDPDVIYDKKSKGILVMAYQGTSWDANGARDTVKMNCFGAQKAIWKSNLSKTLTEIVVQVFGPTVDKYGKEDPHGYIGFCKLSKETASKFVWDNLTWNSAWDVYDDNWILGS